MTKLISTTVLFFIGCAVFAQTATKSFTVKHTTKNIQLDGILGYEFFAQKRTIINYKKEKLYFIDYPLPTK